MTLGCPQCGSLITGKHEPGCTWELDHPLAAAPLSLTQRWIIARRWRWLAYGTIVGMAWAAALLSIHRAPDFLTVIQALSLVTNFITFWVATGQYAKWRVE